MSSANLSAFFQPSKLSTYSYSNDNCRHVCKYTGVCACMHPEQFLAYLQVTITRVATYTAATAAPTTPSIWRVLNAMMEVLRHHTTQQLSILRSAHHMYRFVLVRFLVVTTLFIVVPHTNYQTLNLTKDWNYATCPSLHSDILHTLLHWLAIVSICT